MKKNYKGNSFFVDASGEQLKIRSTSVNMRRQPFVSKTPRRIF